MVDVEFKVKVIFQSSWKSGHQWGRETGILRLPRRMDQILVGMSCIHFNTANFFRMLLKDLLLEDYDFILTGRFQSDPIERRFSQYSQLSGGRFLVSLREVQNSERILACHSLVMED